MLRTRTRLGNVLALLSLLGTAWGAIGPKTDLHIVNKVIAPDGYPRDTILAGGTFPGPLITGKTGDRFLVDVYDDLTNKTMTTPTSIHWHGLFQHNTNWADGAASVTQCPISSGHSFLYNFRVPDQAGTFWYHSHFGLQYCDGLRGPLVVYDPHDPHKHLYDVDDDSTVITLSDWYHVAAASVPVPPESDSTLINGLGRWGGDPTAELAVITVEHGKRYRFRLLSLSCDPFYTFSIDGHDMTIIEADGVNTQPLKVDQLDILAAQRYSFVLEANQPKGNYWIRANPNHANFVGFNDGINSAILRYKGAPVAEPNTTQTPSKKPLLETNLRPLTKQAVPGKPHPGGANVNINLELGVDTDRGLFLVNGAPFIPPDVPVLLQILSGNYSAQSLLPPGAVYTLPPHQSVEISIPGGVLGGPHPFHLHGHAFSVVRSAGSSEYNYKNPVQRDTVNIGDSTDNVTIRFFTDNPGPWFLHCHIDFHLNAGLAVVFAEDPKDTAFVNPVPSSWKELCPTYYAENP
uniref:laccase n=1 Tax=Coriolopsis trogii TaxID=76130 RepID=A0A140CWW4_9APHY|nr:laccase 3 [Coriolopsis trogii]